MAGYGWVWVDLLYAVDKLTLWGELERSRLGWHSRRSQ